MLDFSSKTRILTYFSEVLIDSLSSTPEDGLVGGGPKVEDPVVQPRVLVDGDQKLVLGVFLGDPSRRVVDLKRKLRLGGRDHPHLLGVELHVLLGAALNLGVHFLDGGEDVNDALLRDAGNVEVQDINTRIKKSRD